MLTKQVGARAVSRSEVKEERQPKASAGDTSEGE